MVETRARPWVALSSGGCGILACTTLGRHDEDYKGSRGISLDFAHRVVQTMAKSASSERCATPQLLVETAEAVVKDPKDAGLICTTWQYKPEAGVEICSVGMTSVLVVEGDTVREAILPHSVANAFLHRYGQKVSDPSRGTMASHVLGGNQSCSVDDVRVAHIPLLPTTTIALIANRRLADDILEQRVARDALPSFIDTWQPPGKRIRTSVLISL